MSRLAINAHEIGRVLSGKQTFFLRPAMSSFLNVEPGHALWLAEPFFLHSRWDRLAPTAARDRGARPVFFADHPGGAPVGYGKRHPARSLCRQWHRFHVVVTDRRELAVSEVSAADLRILGFADRIAFEDYWSTEAALCRYRTGTRDDKVLRFSFALAKGPLPDSAERPQLRHLTWAQKREFAASRSAAVGGQDTAKVAA